MLIEKINAQGYMLAGLQNATILNAHATKNQSSATKTFQWSHQHT